MTINGVIRKSFIALFLLFLGATFAWTRIQTYASIEEVGGKIILFTIGGLVLYFITMFNQNAARITVPLYALTEGLILGSISCLVEMRYPGIVTQAIVGTFGVFAAMLVIYRSGIIRPNEKFATILTAVGLGICFIYLANWMMSLFGSSGLSIIHSSSTWGIGFSVVVCAVAALYLLLDFEFIVKHSKMGAPEKLEWIATFGLLLTLVWIYVELLRLFAKLRDSRS
jgi:uncharacterized YccA/Bax inhibitor family protein